jgi:dephospho-CoA kinase
MLIGLTGGIGCGKSAAAAAFVALGFRGQDTDRIVKEEVLPDPEVVKLALKRWGKCVLRASALEGGAEGLELIPELDRVRVAEIVFSDAGERRWWESVVHPRVGALWRGRVAAEPQAEWVIEVPLLFEAGLEKGFDFVVCVGANPDVQLARVIARGTTKAQAGLRIASQFPLAHKLYSAHAVLWNDGSRDFLRAQVATLAAALRG